MSKTLYKLYRQQRCYGCQARHELIDKNTFILESNNMENLITFVNNNGEKDKSYVILKYIDDDLRYRTLQRFKYHNNGNFDKIHKGDLTKTWIRLFYDSRNKLQI
jgi:hypothetical protein